MKKITKAFDKVKMLPTCLKTQTIQHRGGQPQINEQQHKIITPLRSKTI